MRGRRLDLPGDDAASRHARRLLTELGADVPADRGGADRPSHGHAVVADWAESGAMALTGAADGSPLATPAGAASALRGALLVLDRLTTLHTGMTHDLPGVELLGERAAIAGLTRSAPWSAGGLASALRGRDGWWMLSLPRPEDHELIPALVEDADLVADWDTVTQWAMTLGRDDAVERAQLLGLAAATIPEAGTPLDEQSTRRLGAAVRCTAGSAVRTDGHAPVVVDLSSLWAGPLCASLLGMCGADVIKVESSSRLDGARRGPAAFYDLLHAGHRSVTVDFGSTAGRRQLHVLIDNADVVIDSARPRALRQLGIDAERCVDRGIIWVSITAYGRTGPWANRVGYGDDIAAAGGLVSWLDGRPVPVGDAIADPLAGVHAAAATAAALLDDHGWLLDLSMRDVARQAAEIPAAPATVEADGAGWTVTWDGGTCRVAKPRSRPPVGRALEAGADNCAVLSGARTA